MMGKFFNVAWALPIVFALPIPQIEISSRPDPNPWQDQRTPTTVGHNESIGYYSAGCLNKAEKLPADGFGFHAMRLSRNRLWMHQNLKEFIFSYSKRVYEKTGDSILVGDIALPKGGPFNKGHASHQIGLDADIWFVQAKELGFKGKPTAAQRENTSARSMLNPRGNSYPLYPNPPGLPDLSPQTWTPAKVQMIKIAAQHADVERIFVHPYIKKALCQAFGGMSLPDSEWLRKVRPWWSHHEHLHIRIKCPADSPYCRPQEATPPGDGCTDDLAWWFSTAAVEEWRKIQSKDPSFKMPKLPEKCAELLK